MHAHYIPISFPMGNLYFCFISCTLCVSNSSATWILGRECTSHLSFIFIHIDTYIHTYISIHRIVSSTRTLGCAAMNILQLLKTTITLVPWSKIINKLDQAPTTTCTGALTLSQFGHALYG